MMANCVEIVLDLHITIGQAYWFLIIFLWQLLVHLTGRQKGTRLAPTIP